MVVKGARIVRAPGTYNAVQAAHDEAQDGRGLLVADTGNDTVDPVVAGTTANEI